MNRRNVLKIIGLSIGSSIITWYVPKAIAKIVKTKQRIIKGKSVQFFEDSDEPNTIQINVKGSKNISSFQAKRKSDKKYVTGFFPFGEEFNSLEELTNEVITSGQLNID